MPKLSAADLKANLKQFIGTTQYYQTGLRSKSTDGVYYLAEEAECHWLLGIADSVMHLITEDLAMLDLKVNEDRSAKVVIHNGMSLTDKHEAERYKAFHEQEIPWTDFVLDEVRFYIQGDIFLLPSEY